MFRPNVNVDRDHSSSLDFIKPHTEPPDRCVYLLPQCRRCVKRDLNFCFVMVIGMLAESFVRNICCLVSLQRGQGGKGGRVGGARLESDRGMHA